MGRDVAFVMRASKREIEAKRKRDGMLYDASGKDWPKNSLLITRFDQGDEEVDEGKDYFGRKTPVFAGGLDLSSEWRELDGWRELGEVKDIFYHRVGKYEGPFVHEFNKPRGIWRLLWPFTKAAGKPAILYSRKNAFRLELPKGALVDNRGLVVP